jgi:hypothetical protein
VAERKLKMGGFSQWGADYFIHYLRMDLFLQNFAESAEFVSRERNLEA